MINVGLIVIGVVVYVLSAIAFASRAARRGTELQPFALMLLWIYVIQPAVVTAVVVTLLHVILT